MADKKKNPEEMNVTAICSGTVIDHIESRATFKVADILQVQDEEDVVLVGTNLPSGTLGKKGIIKVENRRLTSEEANKIALIAPRATLNIIKDYEVVEKTPITLPESIKGIVRCLNPTCVTNKQPVETQFDVVQSTPPVLRCRYCEKSMSGQDIVLH